VTLDSGTGAVHTAPGHGVEDYAVGRHYGLPVDNPVGPDGRFVEGTPLFAGRRSFDANDAVVATLARARPAAAPRGLPAQLPALLAPQDAGHLPRHAAVVHQHGWPRACAPALGEIRKVRWLPGWGEQRIAGMVETRPGLVHLAPARLGRAARAVRRTGAAASRIRAPPSCWSRWPSGSSSGGLEAWFELDPRELLGRGGRATRRPTT
jgi:isoleucyl-tRNA synthetase